MQSKHIIFLALLSALVSSGVTALIAPNLTGQAVKTESQALKEIQELKMALAKEQEFTIALEQRLLAATNSTARNAGTTPNPVNANSNPTDDNALVEDTTTQQPTREEQIQAFRERAIARQQPDFRRQNLIDRGFAAEEATWIVEQETQVQLDSLAEQYRARKRQAEIENENGTRAKSQAEQLREKLGEDYYERYLEANGLPTSVGINAVLPNSPGASAGLAAGDRILSYGGNRVFNIRDLNGLTILGQEGESVLVEVERNGNPIQITLPRGPIGITGGRGRF